MPAVFGSTPLLADEVAARALSAANSRHISGQTVEADGLGECERAGHRGEISENELARGDSSRRHQSSDAICSGDLYGVAPDAIKRGMHSLWYFRASDICTPF